MNTTTGGLRLGSAWRECERHVHYLFQALAAMRVSWPYTAQRYASLTDTDVRVIDQFILRYSKLQDVMGSQLFPALLQVLQEPYDDRPMIDKLNRLERLGFITGTEHWLRLRDVRNKLSHEYPDDNEKNAEYLNQACRAALELYDALKSIESKFNETYSGALAGIPLPATAPEWLR